MKFGVIFCFLSIIGISPNVNAGKILFWSPFASKSMKICFTPLFDELAKRGHEVIAVIPFNDKPDQYTYISSDPEGNLLKELGKLTEPAISGKDASFVDLIPNMLNFAVTLNQNALKDPKTQKLLQDPNTKFDLVVVNPFLVGEIGYYLGHRFKAPLATYFTGQSHLPFVSHSVGQPHNPSYVPLPMLPFVGEMTFIQRVINTFATFMMEYVLRNTIILSKVNSILDEHFPGIDRPDILELERNVSVVFQYGHPFILDGWAPMVPNYVQLGMMNCRPGKPLPSDDKIGQFLTNSKKGVVYMSFGTVIKSSLMSDQTKEIFRKMFLKFSDYDFIWKLDKDVPNLPKNVLVSNWLPQQDVLAHPNLKVFITHAGQSSFQETLCHQKPVVAIPVSGDQPINGREVERLGFGKSISFSELKEEELINALDQVLHNPKYTQAAQNVGSLLNDQITRPLDRAVWWIEHIIRHPHMYEGKSPVHKLSWYQYFLLDVLAFGAVLIFIVIKIIKFALKICCCKGKRSSNDSKAKQE